MRLHLHGFLYTNMLLTQFLASEYVAWVRGYSIPTCYICNFPGGFTRITHRVSCTAHNCINANCGRGPDIQCISFSVDVVGICEGNLVGTLAGTVSCPVV